MRSIRLRTAALALCACAGTLSAQTQPKIWSWCTPMGNASSDSRFNQFVHYSMTWGLVDPHVSPSIANRGSSGTPSGEDTGEVVANEVLARFPSSPSTDKISILISWLGYMGMENQPGYDTGTSGDLGRLYAHPSDVVTYTYNSVSHTRRNLKMQNGISWMNTWMEGFVDGYQNVIDVNWNPSTQYLPQRFVFDQEVPIIGLDMFAQGKVGEWATYWDQIKTETPAGFSSTLESLRTAAGVSVPTEPGTWLWDYQGGTAANQAFFQWWRGVCLQAYAAAMNEAVYSPLRTAYPNAKFSDYDNSLWLDGGQSVNSTTASVNVSMEHNYMGIGGSRGAGSAFTAPGTNLEQAPHLYPDWSWYQYENFRWPYPTPNGTVNPPTSVATNYYSGSQVPSSLGTPFSHTPFLISDDENDGLTRPASATRYALGYQEYWADCQFRMNRASIDALVRSYPTTSGKPPIVPWITMVNQPIAFAGSTSAAPESMTYDGLRADCGDFIFRQSLGYTYRTLGMLRSRGCQDIFLWNDTGPVDPSDEDFSWHYNRYGPHSQFASNWNELQRAVNEVWGYVPYAFGGTGVTYGTNNDPSDSSIFNSTRLAQIEKCEARADKSQTVEMTTTSPSTGIAGTRGIWASTFFTRTVTESTSPDFLEIDAEVIVSQECTLYTYVTNRTNNGWYLAGTGSGELPEVEGRPTTVILKPGLNRVHLSLPWSSTYFDTYNVIGVALYTLTTSSTTTAQLVENIDYMQVYARYDAPRPRGDYNGDGVADSLDTEMWSAAYSFIYDTANTGDGRVAAYKRFLDIDRDGDVDSNDVGYWNSYFHYTTGSVATDPANDDRRPMSDFR